MQEEQRVRLLTTVACGLHCLVNVREEGIPLLPLHVLEPQAVVAQVETQQPLPLQAYAGNRVGGALIVVDPTSNRTGGALLVEATQS